MAKVEILTKLQHDNPRVLQFGVATLCILVLVLAWLVTLHQLNKNQSLLLKSLEREQGNLGSVLAENLFQVLEKKQTIEMLAVNWLESFDQKSLENIHSFLYGERPLTRVVLYEISGRPFFQSSPNPSSDLQMQRNIEAYLERVTANGERMFIDIPRGTSQNPWQVSLLFPLIADRTIKGVMLLELDVGYILNLLQEINLGSTGRVMIVDGEWRNLACFESSGLRIDDSLSQLVDSNLAQLSSNSGIVRYAGMPGMYLTYTEIRNYPFTVVLSREVGEYLSDFSRYREKLLFVLAALTAFGFASLYFLLQMIGRQHRFMHNLAIANRDNKELILRLEEEHKESAKAASVDPLTGLYNRRLFSLMAQQKLTSAKRNRLIYAVVFIDLDHFKDVNDTYGHRIGDLLLKTVGRRLAECTREIDIVARFGGDEFVIMLSEMSTETDILPIIEKIMSSIAKPCENLDGHCLDVKPSVGIAIFPRDGNDVDSLLLSADGAMYTAKKTGRGRYSFFDACLNPISLKDVELEKGLSSAIVNDEFILHYQPRVRLTDFTVVGLEVLIRWQHPDQLIFPNNFIGIAERSGAMTTLGALIVEKVCKQMCAWQADGLSLVPVSLNVSSLELNEPDYADKVKRTTNRYQLAPELLGFEIIESVIQERNDIVIRNLHELDAQGFAILLDNFGRESSDMKSIRALPIQSLKIDRGFIQDIRNTYNDNPIIYSIIILAQKLNLTVVAEGVETHEQLLNLKVAGCDQVQGYYFSRPVAEEEIRQYLLSPKRSISI